MASVQPDLYRVLAYHMGWVDPQGNSAKGATIPGKALRPSLCLLAYQALTGQWRPALPAAAALELVHNFSLIHDDIQDGDRERHHQPTVWSVWGKPIAITAGNAMRVAAEDHLLALREQGVPAERVAAASHLLTEHYLRMIEGQWLDLHYEGCLEITVHDYLEMVACKTGGLIEASLRLGALLATDDVAVQDAFGRCGMLLGLAFQIQDDLLGAWGEGEQTGKPTGSDILRKKVSFPVVYALEHGKAEIREVLTEAYRKDRLEQGDVLRVVEGLEACGARPFAQEMIQSYCRDALTTLEGVALAAEGRQQLEALANFLAVREH